MRDLELQIEQFLTGIEIDEGYGGWALKYLRDAHKLESENRQQIQVTQQKAFNSAAAKLDRLLELRLNNELTEDEYRTQKQRPRE